MSESASTTVDRLGLAGLVAAVRELVEAGDDAGRVEQIRLLEDLRCATAATQARVTAGFVTSQRAAVSAELKDSSVQTRAVRVARAERGISAQVALARRVSAHQGQRFTGWAMIVTSELPGTFEALAAGRTSEWRAMLVASETGFLSREHRGLVDAELAPRLAQLGDKGTADAARVIGYRLDPAAAVARMSNAEKDRRVGLRPAPDTMARLTALLPVAQGVASIAALGRDADSLISAGDCRSRGQVMADLLVARLTGQDTATAVPVAVNLLIPVDTLLNPESAEPAHLLGYGPVPAGAARAMTLTEQAPVWLRRVFTAPGAGELIAMDSRRRLFTGAQRRFVLARDQVCRIPWCEAPIRHIDHVIGAGPGGPTSVSNAQGLCAGCNYAKQAPGWSSRPGSGGQVSTTTPTGHTYHSRPPAPPGADPPRRPRHDLRVDVIYLPQHRAA